MDERQLTVCAIALFADGYSHRQISAALGVDADKASQLTTAGGNAQAAGDMGYMKTGPYQREDDTDGENNEIRPLRSWRSRAGSS